MRNPWRNLCIEDDGFDDVESHEERNSKRRRKSRGPVLDSWIEFDLTAAARRGDLPRAFEVDEEIRTILDLLAAGKRPILTGLPGVGKTFIIHGLAWRALEPEIAALLSNRRILQLSLRRKVATLSSPHLIRPAFQELIEELLKRGGEILPFFPDFHLAGALNLEAQFSALALRLEAPILCEGETAAVETILQDEPELDRHYVTLPVPEPDFARIRRIARAWAAAEVDRDRGRVSTEAIDEAVHLTCRFLPRSSPLRKTIDLLSQSLALAAGGPVSPVEVIERFSDSCRVPRVLLDPAITLDLETLRRDFAASVLGQDEAVRAVVDRIGVIKAGLSDLRRPFGAFLFAGPTGVGKTHLAQVLAEYLFAGRDRVLRFNMADYQGEEGGPMLFGHPDAHDARRMRGQLTLRILAHPFGVLLLDEFEKAHPKVHDRFFQLMDEGCFINGARETVSCRSMIIIATSNAGAEAFHHPPLGFEGRTAGASLRALIEERLEEIFRPEFLNRFDEIVFFHPLGREHVRAIARREIGLLEERAGLTHRGHALEIDESVVDWLAVHGYDPRHGARFLRRALERNVTGRLAQLIVGQTLPGAARLRLAVRRGRVEAGVLYEEDPPCGESIASRAHGQAPREDPEADWRRAREERDTRQAELAGRTAERDALLERMNATGFWQNPVESRAVSERFRELDVMIQCETRLMRALGEVMGEREDGAKGVGAKGVRLQLCNFDVGLEKQELLKLQSCSLTLCHHTELLDEAERLLAEWREKVAPDVADKIWLVLSAYDQREPAEAWLRALVEMESAWCRRSGLAVEIVACAFQENRLARVALHVKGPACESILAMEEGIHRRVRSEGRDDKARIEMIVASNPPIDFTGRLEEIRRRQGPFKQTVTRRGRLEIDSRGLVIDFIGADPEAMGHFLADLAQAWERTPEEESRVARIYGKDGAGGFDPRTGIVAPRLKPVMKGELEPFREAWRRAKQ